MFNVVYVIYQAGNALVRYLYVKSSLRKEISEVYSKQKVTYMCLFLPQVPKVFFDYKTLTFDFSFFPLSITLLFSYNLICICSNIYLYKFLSQQTESNTATKEVDKKKDRRRNLIPATTGFLFAISFWEAIKMLRFAFLYDSKRTSYSRAVLLKLLAYFSWLHLV